MCSIRIIMSMRRQPMSEQVELIEDMRAAGLAPEPLWNKSTREFALAAVAREARWVNETLAPVRDGVYSPGTEDFDKYFHLLAGGWYEPENRFAWSKGSISKIVFRLPSNSCSILLELRVLCYEDPFADFGEWTSREGRRYDAPFNPAL